MTEQATGGASRYAAFISYRHTELDRKWAKWLHRALETYRVPRKLQQELGLPARLGRVFRDEEELSASSDLSQEIETALEQSGHLIVVCSPRTPGSRWVNEEVARFRELGRGDRILALLVEGEPADAFPAALRDIRPQTTEAGDGALPDSETIEPLAADVRPSPGERAGPTRRMAMLRLVSSMLGCRFDDLRRREQERRSRRLATAGLLLLALVVVLAGLTVYAFRERARADQKANEAERARVAESGARHRAEDLLSFLVFDLSNSLKSIGRLDLLSSVARKAREYYGTVPEHYETPEERRKRALNLMQTGGILAAQGKLEEAEKAHDGAVEIIERLVEQHPSNPVFRHDRGQHIMMRGRVLVSRGDLDGAREAFESALAIHQAVIREDPTLMIVQRGAMMASLRLGEVLRTQGRLPDAQGRFAFALMGARHLASVSPSNIREWDLMICLQSMGDVLADVGNLAGARAQYEEAVETGRRLIEGAPADGQMRWEVAVAQARLGGVLVDLGDLRSAHEICTARLGIIEELTSQDPLNRVWRDGLAGAHSHMGEVLVALGRPAEARKHYETNVAILDGLVRLDTANTSWQRGRALNHNALGELLLSLGEGPVALEHLRTALTAREQLVQGEPTNLTWLDDLSDSLEAMGNYMLGQGDLEGARQFFERGLELARRLVDAKPETPEERADLVAAQTKLGDVLEAQRDWAGALARFQTAADILGRLLAETPSNTRWRHLHCGVLQRCGAVLSRLKRYEEARTKLEESVAVAKRLTEQDPANASWLRDLSAAHSQLPHVLWRLGDMDAACDHCDRSVEIHGALVKQNPSLKGELAFLENKRRRSYLLAGRAKPSSTAEHLTLGYLWYDLRSYATSARHFEQALEDEAIRANVKEQNLYNGACAAARASGTDEDAAATWRAMALAWLRDDLQRRRERLSQDPTRSSPAAQAERKAFEAYTGRLREGEADFASLRSLPEFQKLVAEAETLKGQ